ncbi:dihydroorotate dehydrogenase electron transfer subunit [Geovibrio ferrireducens]|uniref:dihydroorotate dehydrogenase electron transfer subunit n=1 Tax=Geovibrio ferrireducens TaxID=46201 RepID=UPI0022461375|nr:dihydroorotate dehydrogenase electron transfer subunit [Geovibrio ferrireducens]
MKGIILKNERLNDKYRLMEIESPEFVQTAKPGQFVMVKTGLQDYLADPLLRRPFGLVDVRGNTFRLLYMLVGKGTRLMTESPAGSVIEFSSSLGNGFKSVKNQKVALVAGGVGIAPLLWIAKLLKDDGCSVTLYFGGRNQEDIILADEFRPHIDKLVITTDDGSVGDKALVTVPFGQDVKGFDRVYACGPKRMLEAVSGICVKGGVPVDVSLDERMACGMGACLGCIIYVREGEETVQKRCCVEGPVFDGSKVVWESVCR